MLFVWPQLIFPSERLGREGVRKKKKKEEKKKKPSFCRSSLRLWRITRLSCREEIPFSLSSKALCSFSLDTRKKLKKDK